MARAYTIGKGEAGAVSELMCAVEKQILERITQSVRIRGMSRFLTHEMIAKGLFSTGFSSGVGSAEAWNHQLVNKHDGELETKRMIIRFFISILKLI